MENQINELTDEHKNYIQIILRQTDYDYDTAKNKLTEFQYDYEKVIKDYMGINLIKKKGKICETSNQQRYKMIRTAMDDQIKNYEDKNK